MLNDGTLASSDVLTLDMIDSALEALGRGRVIPDIDGHYNFMVMPDVYDMMKKSYARYRWYRKHHLRRLIARRLCG